MKIFNSLFDNYSIFDNKKAKVYCCGPTVYDNIHIGNARPIITTDVLVRFLEFLEVEVDYLQNITDIDDKIISKAKAENKKESEITDRYIDDYLRDLKNLNIRKPNKIIPISEKMNSIIDYIEEMVDKGIAYESNGDVYFDVQGIKKYGELSNRKIEELISGARVEINQNKKNPLDFTLWKKTSEGQFWVTTWSSGRPGWHTECVALIKEYFNSQIDFHIGGIDLKFPHHENERAQFLGTDRKELSKIWVHNGHLEFNKQKMSKSIGNMILVNDFINQNDANTLRYLLLTTHYKQPLDFSEDLVGQSKKAILKIDNLIKKVQLKIALKEITKTTERELDENYNIINYLKKFTEIMEDDLNTPVVITLIESMVKEINKQADSKKVNGVIDDLITILQVLGFDFEMKEFDNETIKQIHNWKELLEQKKYEEADKIREALVKKKII
ncbi:cysteine--tRNA ligase [Spiroplasma alleghenense]|uniref:Cysteine--tRNA ligase n=1 Tax=Spiroplasma alleghenense TaxID=216931 RepID=A0A345Z278_9MOLU|nr:cysteine--tRNA ligase [Spiroplasma alleghenense]AXK50707.1 cysteinyl-tRNA synthetase [Spiroplasma alleghenense]